MTNILEAPSTTLHFTRSRKFRTYSITFQAGGKLNVPALKLYHRFQFEPAPQKLFNPPNDDLFVLLDIRKALESIDWSSMFIGGTEIEENNSASQKEIDK